jgi:glyoxylase-like metal-dependent hydrolase (beta-lactamase superfamily II)
MQIREGLHRLDLPTRLPIGTVNVYLFTDEPVTLLDVGPNCPECHDEIRRQMKEIGLAPADVERIVLSHGHVDHGGIAEAVRKESDAEVLAPEADVPMLASYERTFAERGRRYKEAALRAGAPEPTVDLMMDFFAYVRTFGESVAVSRPIRDGDSIQAGRTVLKAVHTPGHSSGSTCYLSAEGELFAGDTLLKDMTPIAAFGGADASSVGLADYVGSLERVRGLKPVVAHPGHRSTLEDVGRYVSETLTRYRARQEAILRLVQPAPVTPFEIVTKLFGTLPIEELLLGVTEVLGHLEVLAREGVVALDDSADVTLVRLR